MRGRRPSSQAFQDSTLEHHRKVMEPLGYNHEPGMSSDLASETTLENALRNSPDYGVVSFTAEYARERNQTILRAPIPGNEAHVEVMGKKTKGVRKAFARDSEWVVLP